MCIAYAVVGSYTWIAERKECNTFINTIINEYLQYTMFPYDVKMYHTCSYLLNWYCLIWFNLKVGSNFIY